MTKRTGRAIAWGVILTGLLVGLVGGGCAKLPGHLTMLPGAKHSAPDPSFQGAPGRGFSGPDQLVTSGLRTAGDAPTPRNQPTEELLVIARAAGTVAPAEDDTPGSGALMATIEEKQVPVPLKHTDVHASIAGYLGTVEVTQQFHNPYDAKIEAVYVFPLPHNAAVSEFVMTIGERRIRGIIRERQEAEKIYQEAKRQGYVASLLTQERPNIFTQSVANIEPGKQIDVNITYYHTLAYVDGWYEFVFPMVVGPRFNPPGSTQGVGAVARGNTGASGQATEISYLKPNERSGHDIGLRVEVDAGVAVEEFQCKTHRTTQERSATGKLKVALLPDDAIPNRDFVLRYRVAGGQIKSGLITHQNERGGYFSLMLFPPQEMQGLERQPMELVFVLDCSGSMSGRPLAEAKAAVEAALRQLKPGDSFQLINFSVRASALGPKPLEATPKNIQQGLDYLRSLKSEGGTMMIEGIKAALDFPHDRDRLRFVCFLTDGYIGNEAEIFTEIHRRLGASRIFSFGIGSSVNRYLMEGMARMGRGTVAYLGPRDSAAEMMTAFFGRISHPALTDVRVDWGGWQVQEVYPSQIPDLFVGRPVILTGRFTGLDTGRGIRVTGQAAGNAVAVEVPAGAAQHTGLPQAWARTKIEDLEEHALYGEATDLPRQIKELALEYGLMSPYTAFVAVDSSRRTEGVEGTTVPVPVPVPEGVKYDTTVQEK